jgi:hypothetical protein
LKRSRRTAPLVAIGERFFEVDGLTMGALLAIEFFTTVIPLVIIGFSVFTGWAKNASVGNLFIRQFGLDHPLDDRMRSAFGTSAGVHGVWSVVGLASFLIWGIPMSITVATMFARAWRREQFDFGARLARGSAWFVLYLVSMGLRERIAFGGTAHGAIRGVLLLVSLIPAWVFWSLTPAILVRSGGRGLRYLIVAGGVGVAIDGIILPVAARIVFPILLEGWTGFGPMGVAMTFMTWAGVLGVGWVVTACAGAVVWERTAPAQTVIDAQTSLEFAVETP